MGFSFDACQDLSTKVYLMLKFSSYTVACYRLNNGTSNFPPKFISHFRVWQLECDFTYFMRATGALARLLVHPVWRKRQWENRKNRYKNNWLKILTKNKITYKTILWIKNKKVHDAFKVKFLSKSSLSCRFLSIFWEKKSYHGLITIVKSQLLKTPY